MDQKKQTILKAIVLVVFAFGSFVIVMWGFSNKLYDVPKSDTSSEFFPPAQQNTNADNTNTIEAETPCAKEGEKLRNLSLGPNADMSKPTVCCDGLVPEFPTKKSPDGIEGVAVGASAVCKLPAPCGKEGETLRGASLGPNADTSKPAVCCAGLVLEFPTTKNPDGSIGNVEGGAAVCKKPSSASMTCGGIQGKTCPAGFDCKLDGAYPDASGKCVSK